ncbi:MAG: hypothetical protein K1000chlam2_00112 [Chlamydiae bacterium]|nr:hypothetical protein [Chlamydiota bacterium]
MQRKKSNFTLLEIVICVAILGIAAVTVGWQMRNMLAMHHFHKNIDNLLTDLRKCQLIALSDRSDIEIRIYKMEDRYFYHLYSDTPIPFFKSKPMKMIGLKEVRQKNRPIDALTIYIYGNGRIEPNEKIQFFQNEEEGFSLDLCTPQLIELKRINSVS